MIAEAFARRFGSANGLRVFRAPGRVNLIGEHTDYNLGLVLPIALDLACFAAVADSSDGMLRVYSEQRNELKQWPAESIGSLTPAHDWTDYVIGVAQELLLAGYEVHAKSLLIRSTVPEGGGLSSSAALEVASALALLCGRAIAPLDLAELCLRAEVRFVGLPCGIMDQYVAVLARDNAALKIDCRSLQSETVDLPEGIEIVAVNSMVRHSLGESAYKERTEQCAAAVNAVRRHDPAIGSLRDVSTALLEKAAGSMPALIARRAQHVVTESERVDRFVSAARRGDLERMGHLLVESHRSLREDYDVSCPELDFLVEAAMSMEGVLGARMTGGGFGGCTVNLLRSGTGESFRRTIAQCYQERYGVAPQFFDCRPSRGAGEAKSLENIPSLRAL